MKVLSFDPSWLSFSLSEHLFFSVLSPYNLHIGLSQRGCSSIRLNFLADRGAFCAIKATFIICEFSGAFGSKWCEPCRLDRISYKLSKGFCVTVITFDKWLSSPLLWCHEKCFTGLLWFFFFSWLESWPGRSYSEIFQDWVFRICAGSESSSLILF